MNMRFISLTAAVVMLLGIAGGQLQAQQLVLQVDRQSGDFTLTGADANVVDFAGYVIESDRDTLVSGNWNGLRDTEADWVLAGVPGPGAVAELNSSGTPGAGSVANDTVTFDLGSGVYDPATALAGLDLGEDVEAGDLSLTYYDQIADAPMTGLVEFTGEKIFNNVGITVDLATGNAYIENESPNNLTITGYLIESTAGGTLSTDSDMFDGLGGGFQSPTTLDGDNLGEIDSTGTGQLLASSMAADTLGIDLGLVVDPGSLGAAEDDLSFSFILAGNGEVSQDGFVKYINPPVGFLGDFTGDGQVDGADLSLLLGNWGVAVPPLPEGNNGTPFTAGLVDGDDLSNLLGTWGQGVGPGLGTAPVPEPTSVAISSVLALAAFVGIRRAKQA